MKSARHYWPGTWLLRIAFLQCVSLHWLHSGSRPHAFGCCFGWRNSFWVACVPSNSRAMRLRAGGRMSIHPEREKQPSQDCILLHSAPGPVPFFFVVVWIWAVHARLSALVSKTSFPKRLLNAVASKSIQTGHGLSQQLQRPTRSIYTEIARRLKYVPSNLLRIGLRRPPTSGSDLQSADTCLDKAPTPLADRLPRHLKNAGNFALRTPRRATKQGKCLYSHIGFLTVTGYPLKFANLFLAECQLHLCLPSWWVQIIYGFLFI